VPICQSPKIAEVLLQAKTAAANDNYAPVNKTMKALEPGSVFKVLWSTILVAGHKIVGLIVERRKPR
jgi:hypothetical protein